MDSSQIKFNVVCDYAIFEVRTVKKTQAYHIHSHSNDGFSHVQGCDPDTGEPFVDGLKNTTTTLFRCAVQDPKQFRDIAALFDFIAERWGIDAQPTLVCLEIALDAYRKGGSIKELAGIATDLYRFSTYAPGDYWYFYRRAGDGRVKINELDFSRRDIVKHFEAHWQLTDRNSQEVDTRLHAYVKTQDGGESLTPNNHRARFEVTLKGKALPCTTLQDLGKLDFVCLADYFKFRRLADDMNPQARWALKEFSCVQLGRRGKYRRKHKAIVGKYSGTSTFRGSTVADTQLNEVVYECLRKLTRAWRKTGGSADFPEKLCTAEAS